MPEQEVEIFPEGLRIPDFQDMPEVRQWLVGYGMVEREDPLLPGKGD
jgi:hypothetical protein